MANSPANHRRDWRRVAGRRATPVVVALAVIALVFPLPARSHEFWLAPAIYFPQPGTGIEIQACVGTGFRGDPLPYAPARTVRFELEDGGSSDLAPLARNGDLLYARIVPADSTGAVIVYQSSFTSIELPAEDFDRYLALEGLEEIRAARRASPTATPGRERFRRCAKTWVAGARPERVTRAYGLPFEIVPLEDPSRPGVELRVRVMAEGRPQPGTLVRAWRQPLGRDGSLLESALRDSVGPSTDARSGADGIARLKIDQAGEWLVSAVRMVPAGAARPREVNGKNADWESTWASLTFLRKDATR